MALCTACNTDNPESNRFCQNCGQPLPSASVLGSSDFTSALTPPPTPVSPPPYIPAQPMASRSAKDRSIALILEILPGLFGLLGFGWIYVGETSTGLIWLVGFLIWSVIVLVVNILTGGLACLCTAPIGWAALAASAYFLHEHNKKHPELF